MHIGVDLGVAAWACAPQNRGTPMHLSVFTTKIWVCPPNVFDKTSPVFIHHVLHVLRRRADWKDCVLCMSDLTLGSILLSLFVKIFRPLAVPSRALSEPFRSHGDQFSRWNRVCADEKTRLRGWLHIRFQPSAQSRPVRTITTGRAREPRWKEEDAVFIGVHWFLVFFAIVVGLWQRRLVVERGLHMSPLLLCR